jgi:hypothetical protein
MAWNILPHHLHIFWDQQWFIDFEHGFGKQSFKVQPNVKV